MSNKLIFKRICSFFFLIIMFICAFSFFEIKASTNGTKNILINGNVVRYKNGQAVEINADYSAPDGEFRAVWVSALTNDITGFTTKEEYKKQMISVLERMEYYHLNVMIFHVRIMNDAFYQSKYNDWSSYYNTNPSWDMLGWLIEECHKRGIEFHAWMNPYRVTTNVAKSLTDIAKGFKSANAASKAENLLKASSCVILNPGIPEVQSFLVKTCMELVENYDVDAIHFDDYFYAAGIDDTQTRAMYNPEGLSVDNWRRKQIDTFIYNLSQELRKYNENNNKRVQLGISPTGVYRNGNGTVTYDSDGNAITNGSNTSAYAHYGSPLYADTLKWINNNWIDYILPQTYWAITNSAGPYCDLVSWWDKVVKNKKTNLYSSLGLYMNGSSGNASWYYNDNEGYQQIMFANTMENVRGCSIYNFLSMSSAISSGKSMANVEYLWSNAMFLPEIRTMDRIVPEKVSNVKLEKNDYGNTISFDSNTKDKFYVIYKSDKEITYKENEILDVIGNNPIDGKVSYTDKVYDNKKYYYAIKAQSNSLTLGEAVEFNSGMIKSGSNMSLGNIETFEISDNLKQEENIMIRFNNLYYPFGTQVKYQLSVIIDDNSKDYTQFTTVRGMNTCNVYIPKDAKKIEVKLKAYNNLGESIFYIDKTISESLGNIYNFTNLDKVYCNQEVSFIWNKIKQDDITYTLQYSTDDFNYLDLQSLNNNETDANYKASIVTPNLTGEIYYRVKAQKNNQISFSKSIKISQSDYLGDYQNLLVNGDNDNKTILVKEKDKLEISWERNSKDVIYIVMYSIDYKNWTSVKIYNQNSSLEEEENVLTEIIPITYSTYKFYLKVVGTKQTGSNESEIITVYASVNYLYADEVASYISSNNNAFLLQSNIYN